MIRRSRIGPGEHRPPELRPSEPRPSEVGPDLSEQVADAMFALSTPSRVRILTVLLAGPRTVSELTAELGMEQSAVSHQLRILREHRLVNAERDGRRRIYELESDELGQLLRAAVEHVERVEATRPALGRRRPPRAETS